MPDSRAIRSTGSSANDAPPASRRSVARRTARSTSSRLPLRRVSVATLDTMSDAVLNGEHGLSPRTHLPGGRRDDRRRLQALVQGQAHVPAAALRAVGEAELDLADDRLRARQGGLGG